MVHRHACERREHVALDRVDAGDSPALLGITPVHVGTEPVLSEVEGCPTRPVEQSSAVQFHNPRGDSRPRLSGGARLRLFSFSKANFSKAKPPWSFAPPGQPRAAVPTWPVVITRGRVARVHTTIHLLQLRVLRFGFFQHGNIRVGIFPQRQEILVSGSGSGIVSGEHASAP